MRPVLQILLLVCAVGFLTLETVRPVRLMAQALSQTATATTTPTCDQFNNAPPFRPPTIDCTYTPWDVSSEEVIWNTLINQWVCRGLCEGVLDATNPNANDCDPDRCAVNGTCPADGTVWMAIRLTAQISDADCLQQLLNKCLAQPFPRAVLGTCVDPFAVCST
jgi:hypothetical protein